MLYEGGSGGAATEYDCADYAEEIGNPDFPVFADGTEKMANATPMTTNTHPEVCGLAPDMTIISCHASHGGYERALDDIKEHAGL